jgi:farnesyl-diphosphate farnesyltransferase
MDDWKYCVETLPKVSRTFALNISVLKGDLHKSILVAYLFCRTIDTVEDATKLEASHKINLLLHFASILKNTKNRSVALNRWAKDISIVDGSSSDIELLQNIRRVFNIFESLSNNHQQQIISSAHRFNATLLFFVFFRIEAK